jgi:hypothetical protein
MRRAAVAGLAGSDGLRQRRGGDFDHGSGTGRRRRSLRSGSQAATCRAFHAQGGISAWHRSCAQLRGRRLPTVPKHTKLRRRSPSPDHHRPSKPKPTQTRSPFSFNPLRPPDLSTGSQEVWRVRGAERRKTAVSANGRSTAPARNDGAAAAFARGRGGGENFDVGEDGGGSRIRTAGTAGAARQSRWAAKRLSSRLSRHAWPTDDGRPGRARGARPDRSRPRRPKPCWPASAIALPADDPALKGQMRMLPERVPRVARDETAGHG